MPGFVLHEGNCLEVLKTLPDNSVDSIVTDPPYGLSFMGKKWDYDVPSADIWRECLRVLKPGGHLLAFAGTRTQHRMAVNIEDAGFEIRDMIAWVYGCLSEDADILTADGWKRGVDVQVGDTVAQWNADTGAIELVSTTDKFLAPWSGELVRIVNSDTDQLLTPNHRVYWERKAHRSTEGVARKEWVKEISKASELPRRQQIRLPLAGIHDGNGIGGEDYAALLGWVWTEGGFDTSGSGVRIYQSSVNQNHIDTIDILMGKVGDHKRYLRERDYNGRTYTEITWFFSGDLAHRVRADLPLKRPTYELLWRMTGSEKEAFLQAALDGDGSQAKNGSWSFEQKNPEDREWFITLLALTGRRGHDYKRKNRDGGSVTVTQSAVTNLSPKALADDRLQYKGMVWCVSVPSGAFVARRNGKVFITGNSGFPKSLDVSKAIDKAAGAEREVVGYSQGRSGSIHGGGQSVGIPDPITAPATPEAQQWAGWGTALKPSWESVTWATKPLTEQAERNIIQLNLNQLEARLWLLLHANAAVSSSTSSQSEFDEAFGIAQWTAENVTNTRDDLLGQMDMSLFELATTTSLNIVSSWSCTLAASSDDGSTSTTETESRTTIDWRTLSCCLSQITPKSIIRACSLPGGFNANATTAESYFNASLSLLQSIRTLSATERAISQEAENCRGVGVKPSLDPCVVARKPLVGTVAENVLRHGTGGINVDGCRVGTESARRTCNGTGKSSSFDMAASGQHRVNGSDAGRWPANLILAYPEDEYILRDDVTPDQLHKLAEWMNENAKR